MISLPRKLRFENNMFWDVFGTNLRGILDSSKESFSAGAMVLLGPLGHFGVRLGQKKWSGFFWPPKTAEMPGISKINVIEDDCYLFFGGGEGGARMVMSSRLHSQVLDFLGQVPLEGMALCISLLSRWGIHCLMNSSIRNDYSTVSQCVPSISEV